MVLAFRLIHQVPIHRHISIWTTGSATKIWREVAVSRKALFIPSRSIIYSAGNRMAVVQNIKLSRCFINKEGVFSLRSNFCAKSNNGITANVNIVRWGSSNAYLTINQFKQPEGFSEMYINKQRKLFIWFPAVMFVFVMFTTGMFIGNYFTNDEIEKLISEKPVILDFAKAVLISYAVGMYIVLRFFHTRSLFSIYRKDGLEKLYIAVRPKYGFWIEEVPFKHEDVKVINETHFDVGKYKFFVKREHFVTMALHDELIGFELQRRAGEKGKHVDKFQEKMKKKIEKQKK